MNTINHKVKILFWKTIAIIWDLRPKMHLPKYKDFPIASTDIANSYTYPEGFCILYEWNEKGKHWIVFTK